MGKCNVFLGLALVMTSVAGLATQNNPADSHVNDDFDIDMLVQQVSQTRALGLLTKLSLKQDIDRLLKNINEYHAGAGAGTLEQLHERYDVMVHKLLLLLQDKDTELVKTIENSRDTLWLTLATDELAVTEQPDTIETNVEPAHDLRSVIVLAGYPCTAVVEYSQPTPDVYQVSCDTDRRYRVHVDEKETVLVDQWYSPAAEPRDEITHEENMKRHFASIVNLAGHDCAGVVNYEHYGSGTSTVTCADLSVYRIHVTPESRLAVEKQLPGN